MPEFLQVFLESSKTYVAVSLPEWLDLAAVAVGAISGVFVARERRLDPVGFMGLAIICGLGGGLIRDALMNTTGVYMLDSAYAIPTAAAVGLLAFCFPGPFDRWPDLLEWVDIISVGLFVVVGTDKAVVYGYLPVSCVFLGTITGVGGGMLRDVCMGDVPRIFRPGPFYALCALAGAVTYWGLVVWLGANKYVAAVACVLVVVGLRRWSLAHDARTPADVDLGPSVMRQVDKLSDLADTAQDAYDEHSPFLSGHPGDDPDPGDDRTDR